MLGLFQLCEATDEEQGRGASDGNVPSFHGRDMGGNLGYLVERRLALGGVLRGTQLLG